MTGLGADMFILYYNANTREVKFINGTGYAAQAATIDFYNSKGGIPEEGPLSIAVPGAVGGAAYAVQKYGTRPLADVLAPAIEMAESGFPITETLARGLERRRYGSRMDSRSRRATFCGTRIWRARFERSRPREPTRSIAETSGRTPPPS
jgi:gamma-glutamyltranspeptidase